MGDKPREKLIYDRTNDDVTNKVKKAYYNYNDLNRVEEWCAFLKTQLNEMGYKITFTTKTNWVRSDYGNDAELERIRQNIQKLITGFKSITTIYSQSNKMTWDRANNYERILSEMYSFMQGTQGYYVYSDVANAGQARLWQVRFRKNITIAFVEMSTWQDFEDIFEWQDFSSNYQWNDFA